jgi:hypothetical protein
LVLPSLFGSYVALLSGWFRTCYNRYQTGCNPCPSRNLEYYTESIVTRVLLEYYKDSINNVPINIYGLGSTTSMGVRRPPAVLSTPPPSSPEFATDLAMTSRLAVPKIGQSIPQCHRSEKLVRVSCGLAVGCVLPTSLDREPRAQDTAALLLVGILSSGGPISGPNTCRPRPLSPPAEPWPPPARCRKKARQSELLHASEIYVGV